VRSERANASTGARRAPPVASASDGTPRPVLSAPLTERERDVLSLLVSGLSYEQIARQLFVTQSTVGYHLGNIYDKVGVRSRHRLTELARRCPDVFVTGDFS
jgi:DNA-binding CsgD family transcriptional regulator